MDKLNFKTTKEIVVSDKIADQIIGQDQGLDIIKKASSQRRNVLLIGEPGTGKSMLGQALAELLPKEKLVDVLSFDNASDENIPIIKVFPKGKGKELIQRAKIQSLGPGKNKNFIVFVLLIIVSLFPYYMWKTKMISDVIYAASLITGVVFILGTMLILNLNKRLSKSDFKIPKILIDNSTKQKAPFIDATGAHAGALLGDCLHDPLQSGGLGTPSYERLVPGFIHRANGGVLFIDEIANLDQHSQQELLTALQEKKYPITGQSERSSGSMVRSEPAPADFILVAAGNFETIKHLHPALRSRIRGYGYEVYMNENMPDTLENQNKIARFVAQEVKKDDKIPPFSKEAVDHIIYEARLMAGTSNALTVRLRELGGLVRAAGDIAIGQRDKVVEKEHILKAKNVARTLEQQMADKYIEQKKKYQVIITSGKIVGRVNGLAVIGSGGALSGIMLPIESEVTPGGKRADFIATGKLGEIAKEAVKNVSAIVMKYFGEDIKEKYDIYCQFLGTSLEGVEGDSASIAVATSIISALKKIPVRQDTAMTGSLSIRGEVLAVGGINAKVLAAIEAGVKRIIIPESNKKDIVLRKDNLKQIKIIPVNTIQEVLKEALVWEGKQNIFKKLK
ncbi:MAG: ATP-dependent protease LonB [Candidatus Nanoarchaeia archaeon]|nr:ATP-dependent protease LonB [Candidatus Nanoarchaeia archaeon]MDD5587853.1 ATP-dependent protease LonB [Candidatus Nanoarchaeia archaeon]